MAAEFVVRNPGWQRESVFATFAEVAEEGRREEVAAPTEGQSELSDEDVEAARMMDMPIDEYRKYMNKESTL